MYTVDGMAPDGNGYQLLLTGSGIRGVAGRRAAMVELPGMEGVLPDYGAPFMPETLPLRYQIDTSSHAAMMGIIEMMNGVFGQRRKLLRVVHQYAPGVTRVNDGMVLDATPPETTTDKYANYAVNMTFPLPFWRSAATLTAGTPALTSTLAVYALQDFTSTAPIVDSLVRVKGAFSTAAVIDAITGDEISINTPLTASEYAVIDCANWTARKVSSDTWSGGTDISHLVSSNRGQGSMFTLEPDQLLTGGRYRVRVRATNPASSPTVEVRARLSYH